MTQPMPAPSKPKVLPVEPLTARDIEVERLRLAGAYTYLELARKELAGIIEIEERRHDAASLAIVGMWRDDLGELADVIDCALIEASALSPGDGGDE